MPNHVPNEILLELELLVKDKKANQVSQELIEMACSEGQDHVKGLWGKEISLVQNLDKTLIGQISKLSCMDCKKTHMQAKLGPEGSQLKCLGCGAVYPKEPLLYNLEKHMNLQNYMNVVFFNFQVNNNITNITNNNHSTEEEFVIGWNQFVDDPISIFEDEATNKMILKAMSGTHSRIAKLFSAMLKEKTVHCSDHKDKAH